MTENGVANMPKKLTTFLQSWNLKFLYQKGKAWLRIFHSSQDCTYKPMYIPLHWGSLAAIPKDPCSTVRLLAGLSKPAELMMTMKWRHLKILKEYAFNQVEHIAVPGYVGFIPTQILPLNRNWVVSVVLKNTDFAALWKCISLPGRDAFLHSPILNQMLRYNESVDLMEREHLILQMKENQMKGFCLLQPERKSLQKL